MAAITTFDGLLARISNEFDSTDIIYSQWPNTLSSVTSTTGPVLAFRHYMQAVPSPLPTGVTAYIPTEMSLVLGAGAGTWFMLAEMIDLGSINISGASGTFTDGNAMPTRTELGISQQVWGPIYAEVTTGLNSAPGSLTVTYTNQAGTPSQSTGALALTAGAIIARCGGFLKLAAGDVGAVDITAASRSIGTTPTGVIHFYGIIPVSMTNVVVGTSIVEDIISSGVVRRLPAGAQLGLFTGIGTVSTLSGFVRMVGDS